MRRSPLVGLAAAAVLLAACGDGTALSAGIDRAGGAGPVTTLRLGTADAAFSRGAELAEEFARLASELSDGTVTVEVVLEAEKEQPGQEVRDGDQVVARKVAAGEFDLGLIPAWAWDTEGVESLRVLQAPLLIDSHGLLAAVAASEVADEAVSGLDAVGVTGLALLPESLRHPFAFGAPLLNPVDYEGVTIRSPRSQTVWDTLRALGAEPADLLGEQYQQSVAAGTVAGVDSDFLWASRAPAPNTATGNVTLYAKFQTLVAGRSSLEGLSNAQQEILQSAAQRTLDWAVDELGSHADLAEIHCAMGGAVVLASDADLDAMREALEPLQEAFANDGMLERIRALRDDVPPEPAVEPCGNPDR